MVVHSKLPMVPAPKPSRRSRGSLAATAVVVAGALFAAPQLPGGFVLGLHGQQSGLETARRQSQGTLAMNAFDQVTYSDFLDQVDKGNVESVKMSTDLQSALYVAKDGVKREVNLVPNEKVADELFDKLTEKRVPLTMRGTEGGEGPLDFLSRFAGPIAWVVAGLLLLTGGGVGGPGGMAGGPGGMAGAGGNPFQLGKNSAKVIKDGDTKTKFDDVAGCDGAKLELVEVVDFLKNRDRYTSLGAKIPKGALLVGPPGTGKTLLAKAVAGEAGVPFYSISASEFVEVYQGIGAARVRDLFAEAKKSAPCIIFIDEIDAVGRQRSAGFGQGNDEREQTVNQLLTEMDGFDANNGVVVIAATNRADILDQALVRPGRFDRQIQVDPPDVDGRTAILKVHAKNKTLAPGVDLAAIARQTPGLAGADLANLLNEGAIMAARRNRVEIEQEDIFDALERISIGLEKKDAIMSQNKRNLVAYHEAGHAILGALMNDYDAVAKISIVPRGPAGGVTIFMPSEERLNSGLYSKEFLKNRICVALGGRIAEELLNGKDNVTTGASNDFQQCTQVAQAMVMQLGMSPLVGQRSIGQQQEGGGPSMGRGSTNQGAPPISQSLKELIDSEVKRIVDEQYQRGMNILESNRYLLDRLAQILLKEEKMGGEQLMKTIGEVMAEGKLVAASYIGERQPPSLTTSSSTRRPRATSNESRNILEAEIVEPSVKMAIQEPQAGSSNSDIPSMQPQLSSGLAAQILALIVAGSAPDLASAEDSFIQAPDMTATYQQVQQQQQPAAKASQSLPQQVTGRLSYSRLLAELEAGTVQKVDLYNKGLVGIVTLKSEDRTQVLGLELPGASAGLIDKLQSKGVALEIHAQEKPSEILRLLGDTAVPGLVIALLLFARSQQGGGSLGGLPGAPGQAKVLISPKTEVKFQDVAGIDEAKEELTEIVDFLKAPERFVRVGAKIPKGVLLTGPPGTGKTLMAKALAGESGVPFIQASASEFIEMFVGVGASRVRDIFKQAKEKAPCIIFIDEIDAIGRQRGSGMGGGNDEREQTLNQMLTEMDGFQGDTGVIVVAATNRSDILDNALLRPGRFDRRVEVGLPDVKGREQILQVHIMNKKLAEDVELLDVAKRTAGFSGADLENLMNEAAILAARRKQTAITNEEIVDSTDRVIAGLAGRALSENSSKKLVAYHEAGHALVGTLLPWHDPVNKVTIIPRGQAKGLTWFSPAEDQSLVSQSQLKARIAGALGGRAAEQTVFGTAKVTSGAGGDLQQVERLARSMVTQFGMSSVGSIVIDNGPGRSEDLAAKVDDAIRSISDECYLRALEICTTHRAVLDKIAEELVETETMTGIRLVQLLQEAGVPVPEKATVV